MSTQTTHWRKIAIKLIAELRLIGYTYKQISTVLGLSEDTVRVLHTHWGKIYLS